MQAALSKIKKAPPKVGFQPVIFLSFVLLLVLLTGPVRTFGQTEDPKKPGGEISGTVFSDRDNQPATQVVVRLQSHALGIFRSVLTDFAGHFEVRSLPPGAYEIKVEEQGFETTSANAELNGAPVNLVLRLKPEIASTPGQKSYMVSFRELKISDKARGEYNKGLETLLKKDWTGSLDHFSKAVKAFPDYYEAYYHIGLVQTSQGQLDDAFAAFQKAVDLSNGRYVRADFGIGYVLYLKGKMSEAEQVLRRGLRVDDHWPEGYVILGMTLLRLDRPDEAENCGKEALLRDPNFAKAYLVLADAFARKHNYEEQLQNLDSYLNLEPNGPLSDRTREVRNVVAKIVANLQAHR